MELPAGKTSTITAYVTNRSTKSGAPYDSDIVIGFVVNTPTRAILDEKRTLHLSYGVKVTVSTLVFIPSEAYGEVVTIAVSAYTPAGELIKSESTTGTVLPPEATVTGKVYDFVTNLGIPGVQINVDGVMAVTGADGMYNLLTSAGTHSAFFTKDGYETTIYQNDFVLAPGANVKNVGMIPSPTPEANLTGKVTDAVGGAPIEGVAVTLTGYRAGPGGDTIKVLYEARTDVSGNYAFTGVLTMDYALSFVKDGYEPKQVAVDLVKGNQTYNETLKPLAVGALTIYLGASLTGATVWNAKAYNIETKQWVTAGGIKEPHIPAVFPSMSKTFLLMHQEQKFGGSAPWFGPYLITINDMGSYVWNPVTQRFGSFPAINVPATPNAVIISGNFDGFAVTIEEVQETGNLNVAKYFIGVPASPCATDIPYDEESGYYYTGPCTGQLTMRRNSTNTDFEWYLSQVSPIFPYPPEYYVFTGSLVLESYRWPPGNPPGTKTNCMIRYTVGRQVPGSFKVAIAMTNQWGISAGIVQLEGPGTGLVNGPDVNTYATGYNIVVLYANADPTATYGTDPYGRWNQAYNQYRGWVRVTAMGYNSVEG